MKGISFDIPREQHRRAGRRVGIGQVGHVAGDARAAAARELDRRIRRARSSTADATSLALPIGELRKLRGADISMIFQEPMTSLNPVFTVGWQLEEVLRLHMGMSGARGAQARGRAAARGRHSRARARGSTRSRRRCRAASSSA